MFFSPFSFAHTPTLCNLSCRHTHFFCKHIHSAHPLSHTHIQTEPLSVLPFLHLFHFHTHPHSNPSLPPSLPLSPTQFVSWFLTGWAVVHALTEQAISCLMPIPQPLQCPLPPPRHLGQPWHKSSYWVRGTLCSQEAKQRVRRSRGGLVPSVN